MKHLNQYKHLPPESKKSQDMSEQRTSYTDTPKVCRRCDNYFYPNKDTNDPLSKTFRYRNWCPDCRKIGISLGDLAD